MSSVVISGDTSGSVTLSAPAVAGSTTLTLPTTSGTVITTASTAVVTQAMLGTNVVGNGPAFSAYQPNASVQSITNSVWTKINFQSEEFDTNNNFASSRFTPTVAGYYQLGSVINCNFGSTQALVSFYKNGSEFLRGINIQTGTAGGGCFGLMYLNGSTDYVEVYLLTSVSGSLDVDNPSHRIRFDGYLARSA